MSQSHAEEQSAAPAPLPPHLTIHEFLELFPEKPSLETIQHFRQPSMTPLDLLTAFLAGWASFKTFGTELSETHPATRRFLRDQGDALLYDMVSLAADLEVSLESPLPSTHDAQWSLKTEFWYVYTFALAIRARADQLDRIAKPHLYSRKSGGSE